MQNKIEKNEIQSYVIHILGNNKRMKNIQDMIPLLGKLQLNIFPASIGKDLNIEEIREKYGNRNKLQHYKWIHGKSISRRNQLGCFMSHLRIIEEIKNNNIKNSKNKDGYTIIFEDDFLVKSTNLYNDLIKIIDNLKDKDYDMVYIGNIWQNHKNKVINNIYEIDTQYNITGTHGYFIKNSSAEKIYKELIHMDRPIDLFYSNLIKENILKAYVVYPTLIDQQWESINSTIKQYNQKKINEIKKAIKEKNKSYTKKRSKIIYKSISKVASKSKVALKSKSKVAYKSKVASKSKVDSKFKVASKSK
jgi:GR25 family glycosyltransferase involved in LPS biosynthesis